ncbi:hypothetical protein P4C99_15840 [Pontiellaceae bacterium B1224]|nr:hypothetical protein [Pontiellaceae bacterium B1224]
MKNKTPIWTYIITFLNPIIPSCIMIVLAMSFVMITTTDSGTKEVLSRTTFIEMHYVSVLLGLYLSMTVSLLYYYVIREGILRPRWWMNMLLILFAYGIIPLSSFVLGAKEAASAANAAIGKQFGSVVLISIVAFIVITIATKGKIKQAAEPS